MPLSLEEYQVAEAWGSLQEYVNNAEGEGIRLLERKPFEDSWGSGLYYHCVYRYPSFLPSLVKTIAEKFYPNKSLDIHEQSWIAYPRTKTKFTNNDFLKNVLTFNVDTLVLPDLGTTENAHELPQDQWKRVSVQVMDVASKNSKTDFRFSSYKPESFTSLKTGRGPLSPSWIEDFDCTVENLGKSVPTSCVCAYKLITCEFKYFGIQRLVQDALISQNGANILGFHKKIYCSMDKWIDLTMDELNALIESKICK